MNHDKLENKLQALVGATQRPDPTAAWKEDILSRARREASVIPIRRQLPPRWLMAGWAAAWIAIMAMRLVSTSYESTDSALQTLALPPNALMLMAYQQQ